MSHLVTQTGPIAHSPGWPPARPAPGPHARGRGSSSGSGVEPANAPGSPPCSPCGRDRPSNTAGAAHCAGPGGTTAGSSDTCIVFASSSAGILQPPIMRISTPERDLGRRRAEENEEGFTGSFSKKTPSKKTGSSHRWNQYTFRSVMASCHTSFYAFSVPHGVCGKARPAGNIQHIAKGRNTATGPVGHALRELAVHATAALWPLPICWILAADHALH